jgi:CheY-like chemotaxis protein
MLTKATPSDLQELPPIVLLIDEDAAAVERYESFFSDEHVWIANAATPEEALAATDELRPDLVVCALECHEDTGRGAGFIADLKRRPETSNIPVILLARAGAPEIPEDIRQYVDVLLHKPVPPTDLLCNIRRVLASSAALRARGHRAMGEAGRLRGQSDALIERSALIATQLEDKGSRRCPVCRNVLEWIERGQLDAQEFDYYRWCASGCGLYCFNRTKRTWTRLA